MKAASPQDILSPLGQRTRPLYPLAPRARSLEGLTIGLLDNSKRNADLILDEIGKGLMERGAKALVQRKKPSAAIPAGEILDAFAVQCDAVINAHGDCGSCTSWCIHDSVDLERLGLPVATINTEEFVALGRFEAAALGMPTLPIVTIPHPIGSVADSVARAHARAALEAIIRALTGNAAEIGAVASCSIGARREGEDCGCD